MTCLDDAIVLGLVEGRLPPSALAAVDEHIDGCASCRDVVTLVAGSRSQGRVLARGDTVGRFVIGDLLGTGAMGRVYSAWEPELDRRVAIKMLIEDGGTARDRLVREAQAMARLNHPNVVTVHEVGTTDAGVFVAMELVEGDSLRAWTQPVRPWRDVVAILIEIARGLAAVHAAGVVHRDVKPDNMIVGADGRVRLGDFGLARSGATSSGQTFAVGTDTTVAGTPVYMAPEVLRGGAATAASDQFSFGVMAYELLAGWRPFAGTTWAELLEQIERGQVAAITGAPGWLDAAARRCLAVEPAERFASLQAVTDHLAHHANRQRPTRWIAAALATAVMASGATLLLAREDGGSAPSCAIDNASLPALGASHGFLDERVRAALERWIAAWKQERAETCRLASNGVSVRGVARERCLDERRAEMVALVAQLTAETAPRALDALASMPPPLECRSAQLDSAVALPLEPSAAAAAREVIAALPGLRALVAVGKPDAAATSATELVLRARVSGHAPTLADALVVHAEALRGVDRLADANTAAREAVAEALRGRADTTAARAWLTRIAVAGDLRDLASADDFGVIAAGAVERAGSPPHMTATLVRLRGLVAYNRGKLDEARALLADARVRFVALSGARSLDVASVESALGSVARQAGDLDEAERRHRSSFETSRALRGEQHRDIARDLHNIAGVLRLRGQLPAATIEYRKALAIEVATQGVQSIAAGLTHNSLGLVLMAQADWAAAHKELTLAHEILTSANHGDRAFAEHNLGLVEQALGEHRDALARFDAAAVIYQATIGGEAPAARRLVDDRRASELAVRSQLRRPPVPRVALPPPVEPPGAGTLATQPIVVPTPPTAGAAPKPAKPPDVGVYGSGQRW